MWYDVMSHDALMTVKMIMRKWILKIHFSHDFYFN